MAGSFLVILFFGKRFSERRHLGHRHRRGVGLLRPVAASSAPVDPAGQPPAGRSATDRTTEAEHETAEPPPRHRPPRASEGEHADAARRRPRRRRRGGPRGRAARRGHHVVRVVDNAATIDIKVGTLLDGLTAMMLFTVTLISLLVHIYSKEYLQGRRRFTHYYAFLSLFTAAMLFYVLARTRCRCWWAGSSSASVRSC